MNNSGETDEGTIDNEAGQTTRMRWALAGLSIAMLLASMGTSIANVALPALMQAFGTSFPAVQWVVLAYLLATTGLIVSMGSLGDILGRRRLLLGGVALFTAGSLLGGCAATLGTLIAARLAQGTGAAAMMALALASVGELLPKEKTGRAMGLMGTMSAIGTALGPSLGGFLLAAWSWRALFLINVPLGVAAFCCMRGLPAERTKSDPANFDGPGMLLLVLALTAYAIAMTMSRGLYTVSLLILAAIAGGFFVGWESKTKTPLVRLTLLREAGLRASVLTSGLVSTVMMTTLVIGPFYLSIAFGLKAVAVGLVLSVGPVVAAVTGLPAGYLVERLSAGRVVLAGLVGIASGAVLLVLVPTSAGVGGYVAPIVIITASYALFQTANNTAVMRDVAAGQRGVVSGLLTLARNLGLITGAALMSALFAWVTKASGLTQADPAAVVAGMRLTFAVAASLTGVAIVIAARGYAEKLRLWI